MDNLEFLAEDILPIDTKFGNILVSNLEDNKCSFYTDKHHLYFYDYACGKICCIGENVEHVNHLKFLTLHHVLFITTDFDLIVYDHNFSELTVVYSLSTKISTVSWNPNETILIIVDIDNAVHGFNFECNTLLRKFEFLPFSKAHLNDAVPNSMYVGWGSHTTQFKGSKKIQDVVEEFPQKYALPLISWRGNGEQLVINFWKEEKRYIKVFDSTLKALHQSCEYPNLLRPTSFKGQGNFIACVAGTTLGEKPYQKVVIFEKNCLVKSEFAVPENKGKIKDVLYHPDQNLLAVYSIEETRASYLNIYFLSNAHWYLKQQLFFNSDEIVKSFKWTNVFEKAVVQLDILTSKSIYQIVFRFIINRFPNGGCVLVVDGKAVYFIDYSLKVLPPPIFLGGKDCQFLHVENPVNKILFHPTETDFVCFDSKNKKYFYRFSGNKIEPIEAFPLNALFLPQKNNSLVFSDTKEFLEPLDLSKIENSHLIYCTAYKIGDVIYEIAVDRKQDLLINKFVVCHNILSIYIYNKYLLLTHASSKLYCVRLTLENVNKSSWFLNDFFSREVEQGSKIVCVTNTPEIVLELPRGNLEAITCRLISIDIVEKILSENKWKEVVDFIRKQRLNWNLLIDLNPERFSNNLENFMEACGSVSVLNQIITEFSDQNCLKTMYLHCADESSLLSNSVSDKQKVMFDILKYVVNIGPVTNLVAIVNLQIKHFTLKSALKSVCSVFEAGELDICKKAVFQILLYCHNKEVIRSSFALYNIEFVGFIYSCCSEDPRIFEPELDRLRSIQDPVELRYEMCILAKNPILATKYLVTLSKLSEDYISDFIVKNQTQQVAYERIYPELKNFKLCSGLLAKYLSLKTKHDEAGFIYNKAQMYSEALNEYRLALNTPRVLSLIIQTNLSREDAQKIIIDLANALVNAKRIDEAVNLYEFYIKDVSKAIEIYIEKGMFQKALCMAMKYNLKNFDEKIKLAVEKYKSDLVEKIIYLKTTFLNYADRLEIVRNKRLTKMKQRQADDNVLDNENTFDMYSEYGSIMSSRGSTLSSSGSKMSTLSSKQRRKQEKKKMDLREGGIYEDIALIRYLYNIILDIFACGPDVKEICLTLTDQESFNQSRKLYFLMCQTVDVVKANISKIWSTTFVNSPQSTDLKVLSIIKNREELDNEFRTPPASEKMIENWRLLMF